MFGQIDKDIILNLKSGNRAIADALRLLKSSLINAKIEVRRDLTDEETIKIIRKEMKKRIEARDLYAANDRQELADKEDFELKVYSKYVPAELSDSEIETIIKTCVQEIDGEAAFAKIMPLVMKQIGGRADGKRISELVKQHLDGGDK